VNGEYLTEGGRGEVNGEYLTEGIMKAGSYIQGKTLVIEGEKSDGNLLCKREGELLTFMKPGCMILRCMLLCL